MNKELVLKSDYLLDRLEKAIYMGFVLDKKSNDYLNKEVNLDFNLMDRCVSNYNASISKKGYPINLIFNQEKADLRISYLGESIYVHAEELALFIKKTEARICENVKRALKSYANEGVEIFDLDLLVEIKRTGVTTMGDTYKAFNGKKYALHFLHLYRVMSA